MASGIRPPHKSPHSSIGAAFKGARQMRSGQLGRVAGMDIQQQEPFVSQIMRYLRRLPHTIPMPCGPDVAYFGLVPKQVEIWYRSGLFSEEAPLPGRAGNLLHTMIYTFETSSATAPFNPLSGNSVLHVSVESQEDYVEAMRGVRGHERIFWVQAPQFVPLPRNSVKTPFWLPVDHPFYRELIDWHQQATALQLKIDMAKACMAGLEACIDSVAPLRKVWPEITSFLTIRNGVRPGLKYRSEASAERTIKRCMDDFDPKTITDMLAVATLLPEKPPEPLRGWVDYFVREAT